MIVTTFSPEGYEQYGYRFIETYLEFVNYPLVVYVEDSLKLDGIETRNLFDVPGCSHFLEMVKDYRPDSYRNDVNKFCRKVFAITDAALNHTGPMAFIGADTSFHKKLPDNFLVEILNDSYLAYLGREKLHSETDFIAFNTSNKVNKLFMTLFQRIYTTGVFRMMKYTCDSDAFDFIRQLLYVSENNLNVAGDENHPFVNSILGEYADHKKGPLRKQRGQSFDDDYIDKRRIPL